MAATLVLKEREQFIEHSPPRRTLPRWFRIYPPASLLLIVLITLARPEDRQAGVGTLVFLFVGGLVGYLGWSIASLLARLTVTDTEFTIRERYRFRVTRIRRAEICRLVVCTISSSLRYPLLVVVGPDNRCLAQIGFDHYSNDDLVATSNALGLPVEGTWDYEPTIPEMQMKFPGFRRVNLASRAATWWIALVVVVAAVVAGLSVAGIPG